MSRSRLLPRRARICSGVSTFTLAAASSSASGRPSSRLAISAYVLVGLEVRLQLPRTLREERHRVRRGQRRYRVLLLARNVQPLPARRQHARLERGDDGRRLGQQLLEVVEHEQQLLLAHEGVQIVGGAEHLGDGRLHERRIA